MCENGGGMDILVTNNPMVKEKCQSELKVEYLDADLLGILTHIRDRVHKGYKLLTHPMSGSVKPNESPYKSVLISDNPDSIDPQSVSIIEECIQTVRKFPKKHIPEKHLHDLQTIDLALIRSALYQ